MQAHDCRLSSYLVLFLIMHAQVEIETKSTCYGSLSYSTVDGTKKPPFFQQKPNPVIKVNNINKSFKDAPGTRVCVVLKAPCNDMVKLCPPGNGQCLYGIFNNPAQQRAPCCPLGVFTDPTTALLGH